ncbi:MAG: hypothetical protein HQL71_02195 [Magnetococcales bacterium]|nr:hypothetical protein [Magnetococcales bacterium]
MKQDHKGRQMWQKYKELTEDIIDLVHKNQVYAAQLKLDKMLDEMPEFAAELAILAKLSKVGREAGPSIDQQTELQESMAILDNSDDKVKKQREDIDKLKQYLAKLQKAGKVNRAREGEHKNKHQLNNLSNYLLKLQGNKARQQLDILARSKAKLSVLSKNLQGAKQPKSVVHPEVRNLQKLSEFSSTVRVKQRV